MTGAAALSRVTGLQAAQLALAAQLRAWREQMSPREYGALVELHRRFLELEREELEQGERRRLWVAA